MTSMCPRCGTDTDALEHWCPDFRHAADIIHGRRIAELEAQRDGWAAELRETRTMSEVNRVARETAEAEVKTFKGQLAKQMADNIVQTAEVARLRAVMEEMGRALKMARALRFEGTTEERILAQIDAALTKYREVK